MPFGLVTKTQLNQLATDLRREIAESVAFKDELEFAWTGWYAKFRALYARLMKQAKKIEQEELEETDGNTPQGGGTGNESGSPRLFRSRRGF